MRRSLAVIPLALALGAATPALAQSADPAALVAAQKAALAPLAALDGVWRGQAWSVDRSGRRVELTQTERVGPFLDGAVKVVEGRGYDTAGGVAFNAFAVIAYDPVARKFTISSWTGGRGGDFPLTPTDDGFVWTVPAGPSAVVRYTATVRDGTWREVGEYIAEGWQPQLVFEMTLKRIGDSDWPAAGAVPMR
ncbi:MAG: DUF1579 domain-containing protein [Pseudomonadota bacterium]